MGSCVIEKSVIKTSSSKAIGEIMLIQKSKLLLFSLIIVSLISNSTLSFSQTPPDLIKSDLTELGVKIIVIKEQLKQIWMKLIAVEIEGKFKSNHDENFVDALESVNQNLQEIIALLGHESESIITIPHIMEKYKPFFSKIRIENINNTKGVINNSLNYLNYIYSKSEYKASLTALGDPRKDILSALELLDKCISILQQIKEKKSLVN